MSRFDKGSAGHCYPDAALDENNGICRAFNNSAPIYYDVRKALGGSNLKKLQNRGKILNSIICNETNTVFYSKQL